MMRFGGTFRGWISRNNDIDFPECFFGVKGYNHVHGKARVLTLFLSFVFLSMTAFCFNVSENHAWMWLLAAFGLFFSATVGNMFCIGWLMLPLIAVLTLFQILSMVVTVSKILYDVIRLGPSLFDPSLFYPYFDYPPSFRQLLIKDHVQILTEVVVESLFLVLVYISFSLANILFVDFIYIEQSKRMKNAQPYPSISRDSSTFNSAQF